MRGIAERFAGGLRVHRSLSVAAAVALSAGLAACGGSSGSSGGGAPNAAALGPGAQLSASDRECLQKHGLNIQAGGPGGKGGPPVTGTDGPPPGAPGASTTSGPPQGGVFIGPGGGGSGSRQMPENVRKAFQTCGVQPPTLSSSGRPDVNSSAYRASVSRYVACVKQNGSALPAPDLSGIGAIFDPAKVNQ